MRQLILVVDDALTRSKIGTDAVIDLTEGWDFQSSYPLHVNKLPLDRLSEIAFLFGGVGDGEFPPTLPIAASPVTDLSKSDRSTCLRHHMWPP